MKYEKNIFVHLRVISGKTYALLNNDVYLFGEIEELIWKLVNNERTDEQIASIVSEQYNITFDAAYSDVKDYLTELTNAKMIELVV
ncbi:PqqD family protein [Paenibacillus tritici]|uniref:PqqD family protein n=1 Tax=Paenibacillus tritici TaxID=1873425 RepID=A0ABX2DQM2_9BACL|nr:PqqD family protein [Paenibacillus tritici]NQX46963.1 PqqD family protein [Paenibacillus tritici]